MGEFSDRWKDHPKAATSTLSDRNVDIKGIPITPSPWPLETEAKLPGHWCPLLARPVALPGGAKDIPVYHVLLMDKLKDKLKM